MNRQSHIQAHVPARIFHCRIFSGLGRIVLLMGCVLSCLVFAEQSMYPAGSTVPSAEQPNNENSTLSSQQKAQNKRDLRLAQQKLKRLEDQVDAYDASLGELSLELAGYHVIQGNHSEALAAYRRSLHLTRINAGLDSLSQLPILEAIHQLYRDTGDADRAADFLDKILLLYHQNYAPDSAAMADILERVGRWHLAAAYFEADKKTMFHLTTAHSALTRAYAIDQAEGHGFDHDMYSQLLMVNYLLASHGKQDDLERQAEYSRLKPQIINVQVDNAYRRGRKLIERSIASAAFEGDPEIMVRAQLLQADWAQLFDKRYSARKMYTEAYSVASVLEHSNPVRISFNYPQQLPNFTLQANEFAARDVETRRVLVEFNVNEWGSPSRVTVIPSHMKTQADAPQEEDGAAVTINKRAERAAIKAVKSSMYRPAIVGGEPIATQGVRQTVLIDI